MAKKIVDCLIGGQCTRADCTDLKPEDRVCARVRDCLSEAQEAVEDALKTSMMDQIDVYERTRRFLSLRMVVEGFAKQLGAQDGGNFWQHVAAKTTNPDSPERVKRRLRR